MGESACVAHSFSYASAMPNEPINHGNNVPALGESVSFGRFTSESLAWEKWSTFTHKRYVEEAKSYAQPGSVAQKKAFFEAHYKRIAAQKAAAAALLEQEKATATSPKSQVEERVCATNHSTHDSQTTVLLNPHDSPKRLSNSHDSPTAVLKSHEEQQIMTQDARKGIDDDGHGSAINLVEQEIDKIIVAENLKKKESLSRIENLEDRVSVSEDSRASQMERPLLKSKLNTDQEVSKPMIKREPAIPSIGRKPSRIPPAPAKYVASMHPRKENLATPRTKNSTTIDSLDKRRPTPRSLYMLMNSRSVRGPFKLTSPAVRKIESTKPALEIESTKPAPSARTTPKHCATPMLTPLTKAFTNEVNKQPLATPSSVKRSLETLVHPPAAGSKTAGPKWHILSAVSKSLSAYRNKLQSPTISSPFILRTEERAARRKQKLEEKFNEKEARKVQLQTTLKEKAETNFGRLRQSFCFKPQQLPDFYNERETPLKNQKTKRLQTPKANPKLMTPGRKPPSTISRPSSTSSTKNKSSRRLWKNNDQNPTHPPLSSLAKTINHENTSPNIQH